jgi:NAD-dependent DNA ligase
LLGCCKLCYAHFVIFPCSSADLKDTLSEKGAKDNSSSAVVVGERLLSVPGIGPKALESLLGFASGGSSGERKEVDRLLTLLDGAATTKGDNKKDDISGGGNSGSQGKRKAKTQSSLMVDPSTITGGGSGGSGSGGDSVAGVGNEVANDSLVGGKKVAFSGQLSSMSRTMAEQICEQLGN